MLGQLFGVRIYYFGSIYLYALCVVILSTYYSIKYIQIDNVISKSYNIGSTLSKLFNKNKYIYLVWKTLIIQCVIRQLVIIFTSISFFLLGLTDNIDNEICNDHDINTIIDNMDIDIQHTYNTHINNNYVELSEDNNQMLLEEMTNNLCLDKHEHIESPKTINNKDQCLIHENKEEVTLENNEEITLENKEEVTLENKEEVTLETNEEIALENKEKVILENKEEVILENKEKISLENKKEIILENKEELQKTTNNEEQCLTPKNNNEEFDKILNESQQIEQDGLDIINNENVDGLDPNTNNDEIIEIKKIYIGKKPTHKSKRNKREKKSRM